MSHKKGEIGRRARLKGVEKTVRRYLYYIDKPCSVSEISKICHISRDRILGESSIVEFQNDRNNPVVESVKIDVKNQCEKVPFIKLTKFGVEMSDKDKYISDRKPRQPVVSKSSLRLRSTEPIDVCVKHQNPQNGETTSQNITINIVERNNRYDGCVELSSPRQSEKEYKITVLDSGGGYVHDKTENGMWYCRGLVTQLTADSDKLTFDSEVEVKNES